MSNKHQNICSNFEYNIVQFVLIQGIKSEIHLWPHSLTDEYVLGLNLINNDFHLFSIISKILLGEDYSLDFYRFEGNIFFDQKLLVSKTVIISRVVVLMLRFSGLTLQIEFKNWRENEPCLFISRHWANCSDMPLGLHSVISNNDRIYVENIQNMPGCIMVL